MVACGLGRERRLSRGAAAVAQWAGPHAQPGHTERVALTNASPRLSLITEALARSEHDTAVLRLVEALGGNPSARERQVGEPGYLARRLLFDSGGEIILHDDAVVAVRLHLRTQQVPATGIDLSEWLPGVTNDATLDDVKTALTARSSYVGPQEWSIALDGVHARFWFSEKRGWKAPGNLDSVTFVPLRVGVACRPEDDDCPTCSDLLVRTGDAGEIDVDGTITALQEAVGAQQLTQRAHWVKLADMVALHRSGLMERVESQLTCRSCRRILCFTLVRDGSPRLEYCSLDQARRRPLEEIPPVAEWADPARIAQAEGAMRYVDHEPGAWFLAERGGELFLDARYSYSAFIDTSALIRLEESEVKAYRSGGHAYLSDLASRIHNSCPYLPKSPYYARDLNGAADGQSIRDEFTAAIVNHTWISQQRRPR